jgi:dCMP deaminase
VFLRWDKPITEAETVVAPDRIISTSDIDVELMNRAAQEAERSGDWWRPIGGLATRDGEILFTGFNCHHPSEHTVYAFGNPRDNFDAGERLDITPTLHTEQAMIARAARILLEGASVYVTTFPCITCARLLAEAGVMKVYYRDGYSRQDAEGELRDHGIEIILVQDAD